MTEFVTPHLRTVLKTYQDNAPKSLQGPASLSLAAHHNILNNSHHYSQFNVQKREIESPPICTTSDSSIEETTDLKLMVRSPSPLVLNKHATNQSLDSSTTSTSTSSSSLQLSQSPTLLVSSIGCKNILPHPILTTSDPGCGQLLETTLEGKPIGCFLLGGEMRLCLPQILNNILFDFTLDRINRSFDELLMFCSQCTPEQLIEFKAAKILPEDVKACGLITRTNAERLCSALLHRSDRALFQTKKKLKEGVIQFKVYHRCFGKCEGICTPDLFSFKDRSCVECLECNGFFSPAKFVCHVCKDKPKENRTCHWGFDSSKWRAYLHVAFTENNRDNFTKFLDDIKDREVEYERLEREQLMENINQLKRKVL